MRHYIIVKFKPEVDWGVLVEPIRRLLSLGIPGCLLVTFKEVQQVLLADGPVFLISLRPGPGGLDRDSSEGAGRRIRPLFWVDRGRARGGEQFLVLPGHAVPNPVQEPIGRPVGLLPGQFHFPRLPVCHATQRPGRSVAFARCRHRRHLLPTTAARWTRTTKKTMSPPGASTSTT